MKLYVALILCAFQFGFAQKDQKVQHFLPDVVMQFPNVRDLSMSASGDEVYFTAQSRLEEVSVILSVKKENGNWSAPEIASFSGKYKDLEPFLSPDGLRLYFVSDRPLSTASNTPKDFDIWYVQRSSKRSVWSAPIRMKSPVNSEHNEFYPAVSENGTLYFTSDASTSTGKDDIFISKPKNGSYSTPVPLSNAINSEGYEFNAYIAPDESFLMFTGYGRKDGMGSGDLYISYKNTDGSWSKAKNLGGEINSKYMDYCPFVDLDTGTLYFTSKRSALNPPTSGFGTVRELADAVTIYENGASRIYKVSAVHIIKRE